MGQVSVQPPARTPCDSCPYRLDVPSGVWSPEHYQLLPLYDQETYAQPASVFLCHQKDGRVCAGWAGCHDMGQSLGVRMGVLMGTFGPETQEALWEYTTPVPLHPTGQAACDHGMRDIDHPSPEATALMNRLIAKGKAATPAPVELVLAIPATTNTLHLSRKACPTVSLCGRDGMCTPAGYGTIDNPRTPICRRCLLVKDCLP